MDKSLVTTKPEPPIVTTKQEQSFDEITAYIYRDTSIRRFSVMLGEKQAQRFVASVLTAVMADPKLQACTPLSVYLSAVRAATLGLSVDPAYGQAYLVAYGNVCTFLPGYKGFRDKASDNGIACHVDEIYDNEKVLTHRETGEIKIEGPNGFWRPASTEALSDGNGHKISGFLASWWNAKDKSGEKQQLYMTIEQIEEYAETHAPSYKYKDSPWNKNPLTRKEMEKKTVLKILLRKTAPLNPVVSRLLIQFEDDQTEAMNAAFDGIDIKGTEEPKAEPKWTHDQSIMELGFDNPDPVNEKEWNAYLSLCARADAVGVPFTKANRAKVTKSDLSAEFLELEKYVSGAEQQAAAGNESQEGE